MFYKKECIAMLLAGGQGSRLYVLTQNIAKPAVPYGKSIVSLIFRSQTASTQELILWVSLPSINHWS